jgi:hypothetical protein
MRVFNFSNPNQVYEEAYYDTSPLQAAYLTYQGCWGIYPFLPSGQILGSDMQEGLFVTSFPQAHLAEAAHQPLRVYPNPLQGEWLQWDLALVETAAATVVAMDGQVVLQTELQPGQHRLNVPTDLPSGLYIVRLDAGASGVFTARFLK